jgi:hypothetical protein
LAWLFSSAAWADPLVLSAPSALLAGESNPVAMFGPPDAEVRLVAHVGAAGGPVACPAPLAPTCLGLSAPVREVARVRLSAFGVAQLTLQPGLGVAGREVQLQAVVVDPGGSSFSDVVAAPVLDPLGDEDGDQLNNATELQVLGTDWDRADTDQGGTNDLDELLGGFDPLDESDDPTCQGVLQVHPDAGALDVSTVGFVYVRLGRNVSGERFWLAGGGADVDLVVQHLNAARTEALLRWPGQLSPLTTYTLRSTIPCHQTVSSFTTGVAHALPAPASLVGGAWFVDLSSGLGVDGVAPVLPLYADTALDADLAQALALHQFDEARSVFQGYLVEIDRTGAPAQESCAQTVSVPDIHYDPLTGRLSFTGGLRLETELGLSRFDLTFEAYPTADGASLGVRHLGLRLDADSPAILGGFDASSGDDICELLTTFALSCVRCSTGENCVPMQVLSPVSERLAGPTTQVRTRDPVACPTPGAWCGEGCAHGGGLVPGSLVWLVVAWLRRSRRPRSWSPAG